MRLENQNVHRVVLDTNVFVSGGTISLDAPSQIINHWRSQDFIMVASPELLAEYEEILSRPSVMKFTGLTFEENAQYIQDVADRAYITTGVLTLDVLINDPDDNMVLACAEEGTATHLVTGNSKDFHLLIIKVFKFLPRENF